MATFEKLLKQQSIFSIVIPSYILLYLQCQDSLEAKAQQESPRWCWFPHPPPDSPTGHWSAVVSGGQHAALSLVESLHIPASDWCGQWSAGQDWPPAAHHWSAVTSRLVRPARQKLSPTPTITTTDTILSITFHSPSFPFFLSLCHHSLPHQKYLCSVSKLCCYFHFIYHVLSPISLLLLPSGLRKLDASYFCPSVQWNHTTFAFLIPLFLHKLYLFADSAQTEYCPTFHCPSVRVFVCHRRDISHFSHI